MPLYPASLPKPRIEGMTEVRGNSIVRTDMDAGKAKQRRRFTAQIDQWQFNIVVDQADFDTFEQFFEIQLLGGQLAFDWIHPRKGTTVKARFIEPPSYAFFGNRQTQINHMLEIIP